MAGRVIVFRVDASLEMGTGHVMRCLTLANALQAEGDDCHFICREHPGHLIEHVRRHGHKVHALPFPASAEVDKTTVHAAWLGTTQSKDAALCAPIMRNLRPSWLVVDHYALDAHWERLLKPHYQKLLVIDDLADRFHHCDVLLDQTLGRDPLAYHSRVPGDCTILCGAHFALLRPEFASLREYSLHRRREAPLRHILVTMGGVDKNNATGQILSTLADAEVPHDCLITVVMGPTAPWLEVIQRQAFNMPVQTVVRSGVSNMAQLMADSDLAIGAAGATSWERCCLGLPSIMVVLAPNQQQVAKGLQAVGAAMIIPSAQDIPQMLPIYFNSLLVSPFTLRQMSEAAASITGGIGAAQVMTYLER